MMPPPGKATYGIWRERWVVDAEGRRRLEEGWAYDQAGHTLVYDTLAQATRDAGVWRAAASGGGWTYTPKQRD